MTAMVLLPLPPERGGHEQLLEVRRELREQKPRLGPRDVGEPDAVLVADHDVLQLSAAAVRRAGLSGHDRKFVGLRQRQRRPAMSRGSLLRWRPVHEVVRDVRFPLVRYKPSDLFHTVGKFHGVAVCITCSDLVA